MVGAAGAMTNVGNLQQKMVWAVRVVREEALWLPAWLDPDNDSVDGETQDVLVLVLVEDDEND